MDWQSVLNSISRRPILLAAVGATCYLALNSVLILELVEQVQVAPRAAAAARYQAEPLNTLQSSAPCGELGRLDRDICKAELIVDKAAARLKQRRAAREERRARPEPASLPLGVHGESVAAVQ